MAEEFSVYIHMFFPHALYMCKDCSYLPGFQRRLCIFAFIEVLGIWINRPKLLILRGDNAFAPGLVTTIDLAMPDSS